MSDVETRYMTVEQCAVYIGRTPEAVRMLAKRRQIPHTMRGRKRQFDKEKIDNWMARGAVRCSLV